MKSAHANTATLPEKLRKADRSRQNRDETSPADGMVELPLLRPRELSNQMKILAIDFGEKRVGLAITDPDRKVAMPLTTLERQSDRAVVAQIAEVVDREGVDQLIVGEPINMDGSRGKSAERAVSFARKLAKQTGLPHEMINESLTSVAARERLVSAGVDLRRYPERIDAVAAQLLLEEFLAR